MWSAVEVSITKYIHVVVVNLHWHQDLFWHTICIYSSLYRFALFNCSSIGYLLYIFRLQLPEVRICHGYKLVAGKVRKLGNFLIYKSLWEIIVVSCIGFSLRVLASTLWRHIEQSFQIHNHPSWWQSDELQPNNARSWCFAEYHFSGNC